MFHQNKTKQNKTKKEKKNDRHPDDLDIKEKSIITYLQRF